jgi:VCBS repeat-containing protein
MAKITKPIIKDVGPHVTGKVAILYGTVKAVSPDGTVRMLKINSPVFADDRIITGDDGSVSIVFSTFPPTQLDLGRLSDVIIDEDIYGPTSPGVTAEAAAEQKAIQEALMAGDQPIELDATAAGAEPDSGGGHPIFVVAPDWAEVTPESGAETRGVTWGTPVQQEYAVNVEVPQETPPNVEPMAQPDFNETQEGTEGSQSAATGNVLDNDTSGDGSIFVTAVNGSANNVGTPIQTDLGGTITINPDGSYTYTPPPQVDHSEGPVYDVINYTITNSDGNSASSTLTIEVLDTEPIAVADTGTATEGQTLNSLVGVLVNDTMSADVPGTVVGLAAGDTGTNSTGTMSVGGMYGTLTINADGSYSYVANGSVASGSQDVFTYTMQDADGDQSHATLTITFEGDKNVPTAQDSAADLYESGLRADGTETVGGTVTFDPGLDTPPTLTYDTSTLVYGTATFNTTTGAWTYTLTHPVTDGEGPETDYFTYTVTDSDGSTSTGTITITIIDDVPTAVADTGTATEGQTLNSLVGVLVNDTMSADVPGTVVGLAAGDTGTNSTGTMSVGGMYGTLTINADGSYSYVANGSVASGSQDVFTYTMQDADGDQSHATLTITFEGDNNVPTAQDSAANQSDAAWYAGTQTASEGTLAFDMGGDTPGSVSIVYDGGLGSATKSSASGVTTFTASNWVLTINETTGAYSFSQTGAYTHDSGANSDSGKVTVTLTDSDGSIKQATLDLTIDDMGPVAFVKSGILYDAVGAHLEAPFASYGADNGPAASVVLSTQTNSEGIITGVDAGGNPVILTAGGNPIYYELEGNVLKGYTIPDSGGAHHTVFTVTPDMVNGTYSVDVFQKIDVTKEISYDLTGGKFKGGNETNSYFYLDVNNDSHPDNTILWMRGIDPDGKNTVNWNNNGIGVGTNVALNNSETLKITLMDPMWSMPASPTDTNQGVNQFDLTNKVTISFTDLAANEEYSYTLWKHIDTNNDGIADTLVQVGNEVHVTTHGANENLTVFSSGAFDQINITAGTDSSFLVTGASMWTTTEATDVTIHLEGLVTDADGDHITVPFDLTFDGTPSVLVGTTANEVLQGGDGDDTLTGGAGADTFKVGKGSDHITDYKLLDGDKVDITSVLNSAEDDHSKLGFRTDSGNKAVLEIYDDNAHTHLLGSVTFDNITDATDLNSLLGKIDLDHTS